MSVEEFTYLRGRTHGAGQGDAAQRAAGGGLLRSRQVARRLRRRATPTSPISSTSPAARSRSCCGSAASTSRSTRRSTRRCSTRRSARATASAAAIPTRCSTRASSSTTRSSTATPASRSASTSAAATTRACSTRRAATTGSRSRSSAARSFDRFLLEYDDERSGTFEPLRYVPDDRVVVLGLVSSKTRAAGDRRTTCSARIAEAARDRPARAARAQPAVRLRVDARGQPALGGRCSDRSWSWSRRRPERCGASAHRPTAACELCEIDGGGHQSLDGPLDARREPTTAPRSGECANSAQASAARGGR